MTYDDWKTESPEDERMRLGTYSEVSDEPDWCSVTRCENRAFPNHDQCAAHMLQDAVDDMDWESISHWDAICHPEISDSERCGACGGRTICHHNCKDLQRNQELEAQ